MAIYKGREVSLMTSVPKGFHNDIMVTIRQKDGSTESVKLSALQFTNDEKKNLQKDAGDNLDALNVIEDKDLKDLRDSQDEDKVREKLEGEEKPQDVTIQAKGATVNQSGPKVRK